MAAFQAIPLLRSIFCNKAINGHASEGRLQVLLSFGKQERNLLVQATVIRVPAASLLERSLRYLLSVFRKTRLLLDHLATSSRRHNQNTILLQCQCHDLIQTRRVDYRHNSRESTLELDCYPAVPLRD